MNITGSPTWWCRGSLSHSTADDVICVIGACGGTQGVCDAGTTSGNTNPWTCEGGAAGSTADDETCDVGVCGSADDPVNGCSAGDWVDVTDTATEVLWRCEGSHADPVVTTDDIDCTLGEPVCGTTLGACDNGGTRIGNVVNSEWTCEGTTGNQRQCYFGVCDESFPGGCDQGDSVGDVNPHTGVINEWTCHGNNPDDTVSADDEACFTGVCGTDDTPADGCQIGNYQSIPGNDWRCLGSDGTIVTCSPANGACDFSGMGQCLTGTSTDPFGNTNPWTCEGANGGLDATCEIAACATVPQGTCDTGTPSGNTNPWTCEGSDPLSSQDDDPCGIGLCDWSVAGKCAVGDSDGTQGVDYEWACEGHDDMSGEDDMDCVKAQCNLNDPQDNAVKGCKTGTWKNVDDPPGAVKKWHCLGNHPDDTVTIDDARNCEIIVPDGVCGYDFLGDCDAGTSSGTGNEWTCLGPDDATDTEDKDCEVGLCPTVSGTDDTCQVGTPEDIPGDPDDKWWCRGNHPTSSVTKDDVQCAPVVDGVCGIVTDTCFAGTVQTEAGDTWQCKGSDNGGEDKDCPGEDLACGSQENSCTVYGTTYTSGTTVNINDAGCNVQAALTITDTADDPGMLNWQCQYAVSGTCQNGNAVSGSSTLNCEIPATSSCALSGFTWVNSCGGGGIGCDGYYETTHEHCVVTNPYEGALYYQDAVGYGVDFLGATPPSPEGLFTVEYTCCTNCDGADSPITDPDNDCDWPAVTPAVIDGACGTADNAVQGCTAGTYQDEPGDGWTCEGSGGGPDNEGVSVSCAPSSGGFCPPGYITASSGISGGIATCVPMVHECRAIQAPGGGSGGWTCHVQLGDATWAPIGPNCAEGDPCTADIDTYCLNNPSYPACNQ